MAAVPWPVADLLPHKAPMILLDGVLDSDDHCLWAFVSVHAGTPFFRPTIGVPAHVGIEWMAQACGAFAGVRAKAAGTAVKLGFLLGTRRYTAVTPWFTEGERATIIVTQTFEEDGMASFDCRIEINGAERANARLVVFQPEDAATVLHPS